MALGHGGRRPGSGRKPKSETARALDGGASHSRAKVVQHPSVPAEPPPPPIQPVDETQAPNDLSPDERNVWLELAPFAVSNRTLTPATSLGFRMLCRNVALEKQYAASVMDRGGPNHRGLIQRIDAELLRFNLAPCGKPMEAAHEAAPTVDPMKARYFGGR